MLSGSAAFATGAPTEDMRAHCDFSNPTETAASAQPTAHILLSPRMPYAMQEWRRMVTSARTNGFQVVSWRDPRVPDAEWKAAVEAADATALRDAPVLALETAASCGMLNHSPATVVTRCGRSHPWPILGVMPDAAWLEVLATRRTDLEQSPCR